MQNFFLNFIREKELFTEGDKVLLAVSGGLDSVVMAQLFSGTPYAFGIAHVNFGLRGEESEEDARFVEQLARHLGVPFYTSRLLAAEAAEEEKVSIQMAARDLRYQWFEEIRRKEAYTYIATAHHLNDLAETMLLNLSRGTGIAGLHGIASKRGNVVRPLLFATRQQLEDYASQQQLSWREDSSNTSLKYRRNKIRKQVVPLLKELNPRLEWTLQETAQKLGAAERLLIGLVAKLKQEIISQETGHHYLQLEPLLQQQEPQYLLAALLEPFGAGWLEAGAILQSLQKPESTTSGKQFLTPSHRISLDRQQLVISAIDEISIIQSQLPNMEGRFSAGPYVFETRRYRAKGYQLSRDPAVAALDYHKLQFPLLLRSPQAGDWFRPLGMRGKKKLSDFMIDHKIPVNLKGEVLLLISGDAVAWVAGYRPDERFKIGPHTEEVFEIRLLKP